MKPLAQQTLYEILEVPPEAAAEAIDAAYTRARALYGPGSIATYTLLPPEEAEQFMARLEEAHTTLLDGSARARYDERLAALASALPAPASAWAPPLDVAPIRPVELAPVPRDEEDDEEARAEVAGPAPARLPPPAPPAAPRPAPIRLEREVIATTPIPAPTPAAPPARSPVLDATTWTGEILRNVREARGISLQVIADRTKVMRHHLENIEADRFAALPAPVYLRGILLGLARELRLDGQKVARSYLERMAAALGAPAATGGKR